MHTGPPVPCRWRWRGWGAGPGDELSDGPAQRHLQAVLSMESIPLCVCRDASGSPGLDQEPLWPRLAPFFNCEAGEADKPFPRDDPLRSRTDQRWEPQKQWLSRQRSTHFSPCLPGLNETHQRCHRGGELSHGCPGSRCRSVKGANSFHLSQPSLQQAFTAFMEKVTVSWGPSPCPGSPSS